MHGAGQFSVYRTLFEGNSAVMPARFEPEEVWRTVEKYGVNVMQVTGDAMARPLADTLERLQGEVDVSSLFSFASTAAIFSQTVKEQLQELLPEYTMMLDSVGSTETGMNGIRMVHEGRRAEGRHHERASRARLGRARRELRTRSSRARARSVCSRAAATSRSATTTIR